MLDDQIEYNRAYYEACRGRSRYPATEDAYDWLKANKPASLTPTVQWGDARLGNQLFDDDLACRGLVDWEQVTIGFAEADLAWWLTVDGRNSLRLQGLEVSTTLPSDEATAEAYGAMLGRPMRDPLYWRVFASARMSPILLKLDILCDRHGFSRTNRGNNHQEKTLVELMARV
jgi:aminoglycoside phosphotransferase (APT) family kinase protein